MARLFALATTFLLLTAGPAAAQVAAAPIAPLPEADEGLQPWPYPAPDPESWWEDDWPALREARDPLAGRRLGWRERLTPVDSGVEPTLYRLWALSPLQHQIVRRGEAILEVWTRPARSVRQTVTRVTVRRDGKVFVQARAGLACCEPEIARRVTLDLELPEASPQTFLALRDHPAWDSPREVIVDEGAGAAGAICIDGVSYDLTLMVAGRSRSLRRDCDNAEIGEVADVLEAVLGAALGHEPRFDVLFRRGADFSGARRAYEGLIQDGGRLKPAPESRPQPPTFEPAFDAEGDPPVASPPTPVETPPQG